ncbi:unnamed protein product, partial [Bubo scandiacus]
EISFCCKGVGHDSRPIWKDYSYNENLKNPSPKRNVYHTENDMNIDIRLSLASDSIEHAGEILHNQYKQPIFISSLSWEVFLENTKDYGASCL